MYLIIMEDGTIVKSKTYSDGEIDACDDGYIDLIDISDPESPKTYYDASWLPIKDA